MKFRQFFRSGAWLFSGVLLLVSVGLAFYVLLASAEPVKPPPIPDKKFVTAQEVRETPVSNMDAEESSEDEKPVEKVKMDSRLTQSSTFMLQKDNFAIPMIPPPSMVMPENVRKFGPEASNPEPYPDPSNPEELSAQREAQRTDREKRRYDSLSDRIVKLEERLAKVKSENPSDDQVDRLQMSIERLQKRRDDLKQELQAKNVPID